MMPAAARIAPRNIRSLPKGAMDWNPSHPHYVAAMKD
jgi:hypothetical protein